MSEQETDDEKPFEPSQKKLEDARRKGEVPRSVDLTTAAAYGGFLAVCVVSGPAILIDVGEALMILLDQPDALARVAFAGSQAPLLGGVLWVTGVNMVPFLLIPAVFVILVSIASRSFVLAPAKIKPKLNRISPLQGVKNKFGRNGLFEFAKSFAKLLIFCVVLGVYLWARRDQMIGSMYMSPGMIVVELLRMVVALLLIVLVIAIVLGGVDFLWQRAEHLRKHRMSRKEMKEEVKQSEGDPMMKQQRRQKGLDLATNRMLQDVPEADVVVVNPTHFAVALKWDRAPGTAPVCVAKGVDTIAARIRDLAAEHAIPVHSDPATARALHAGVEIGQEVPPDHYKAVAAAIRFAEAMRQKMRGTV